MVMYWVDLVVQAIIRLGVFLGDVVVISILLLSHIMAFLLVKLHECWNLFKIWTNIITAFRRIVKEEDKIPEQEEKLPRGLECNITLPTSEEEAIKRILDCKSENPYSILGVTHDCSDEDIKKYYRRQAFLVHPDKNKRPRAEEAFKIVAHAFEIIGEPEKRQEYDTRIAEEIQLERARDELMSLLNRLQRNLDEAANTIPCTNCNKIHKKIKLPRPFYAARYCAECDLHHAADEGDLWAETSFFGLWWRYYICMGMTVYDVSEWAFCQRENLKDLQPNSHSIIFGIACIKNPAYEDNSPVFPSDLDLKEFLNLCEDLEKNFTFSSSQAGKRQMQKRHKRKGKKRK